MFFELANTSTDSVPDQGVRDSQNEAGADILGVMCTFVQIMLVFIHRGTIARVFNSILRFLPFLNRWTRADLYFPKHR